MKTKQTFAAALIAAGLMSAPVLAQDQIVDKVKDEAASEMTDRAKDKAHPMMKDDVKIKADKITTQDGIVTAIGDPLTIETPESILVVKDGTMTSDGDGMTIMGRELTTMDTPATETPTTVTTMNIACPSGTTAQPDGTCMITGDYQK